MVKACSRLATPVRSAVPPRSVAISTSALTIVDLQPRTCSEFMFTAQGVEGFFKMVGNSRLQRRAGKSAVELFFQIGSHTCDKALCVPRQA